MYQPGTYFFFYSLFFSFFISLPVTQTIQSLFPRLPESGRGTSLFDRGTTAPGPEGDKLRLDTFPFLSSGELTRGGGGGTNFNIKLNLSLQKPKGESFGILKMGSYR